MVASPSAPSPARKRGIRNRPDVGGRLVVLPAGDGGLGEGHRCRRSPGETKRDRGRRRSTPPHPISTRADTSIEILSSPPKTAAIWLHPMQMRELKYPLQNWQTPSSEWHPTRVWSATTLFWGRAAPSTPSPYRCRERNGYVVKMSSRWIYPPTWCVD